MAPKSSKRVKIDADSNNIEASTNPLRTRTQVHDDDDIAKGPSFKQVIEEALNSQAQPLPRGYRLQTYLDNRFQQENRDYGGRRKRKRMRVELRLDESNIMARYLKVDGLEDVEVIIVKKLHVRFRLMDLPAELRLMIFRHLLVRTSNIIVGRERNHFTLVNGDCRLQRQWAPHSDPIPDKRLTGFNLMLTNKILREEAAQMIYAENTFEFIGVLAVSKFLDSIGSNAHFLRHVVLRDIDPLTRSGRRAVIRVADLPQQIRTVYFSWDRLYDSRKFDPRKRDDKTKAIAEQVWHKTLSAATNRLLKKGLDAQAIITIFRVLPPLRPHRLPFCRRLESELAALILSSGESQTESTNNAVVIRK
ncbi:hypothetical protein AMS68_006316 [Peltaster fructicola]|uniref:F-box domain-containing protein n=1 Tax=Peltaster fructicola TaxID=286661 RepID=A0A6H0Y1Q8_9PEZI|nr:hypothetical protein AMS68_006316 [Peltaster fructicola]